MTPTELQAARKTYSYIPARLVRVSYGAVAQITWRSLNLVMDVPKNWQNGGPEVRCKYSSFELDQFHRSLLQDDHEENLLHGLLSVVFWGFASGKDGRIRGGRALARSKEFLYGREGKPPQKVETIVQHLREAHALLGNFKLSHALYEARKIKFLGMSFASKVLTFMRPDVAAVYDAVISATLKEQEDQYLRDLYVSTEFTESERRKKAQCDIYEQWCHLCSERAQDLNR